MHFTKEDYNKIEQWLKRNSVKDTEFLSTVNLQNDDTLSIVQDGQNKKINISNLVQYLNNEIEGSGLVKGTAEGSVQLYSGGCEANGISSLSLGIGTKTFGFGETAIGKFNYSWGANSPIFTVGIGTENDRKNAIAIDDNGELFIINVGGYRGKDISTSLSTSQVFDTILNNQSIVKGTAENSAVLKGEYGGYSNKAISQTSMAVGAGSTAGLKGWYYKVVGFPSSETYNNEGWNVALILSDVQPTGKLGSADVVSKTGIIDLVSFVEDYDSNSVDISEISIGDNISIVNENKYDYIGKVVNKLASTILVKFTNEGFTSIVDIFSLTSPKLDIDDYSVYFPDKPTIGAVDFGGGALAEGGIGTKASNICAHAEGLTTHAYGQYSHTEGRETKAGYAAHAEGHLSEAIGLRSHAEGYGTKAIGNVSHAEGYETQAIANQTHVEGNTTKAYTTCSHAEGIRTSAGNGAIIDSSVNIEEDGRAAHAEGAGTAAFGTCSHAEGHLTTSAGIGSHAEGRETKAMGLVAHAEGYLTEANREYSHAEGRETKANGGNSHAEGYLTETTSLYSHAEGRQTYTTGNNAHAEGWGTVASGNASHAEGNGTQAGKDTLRTPLINTSITEGNFTHAEGTGTVAIGNSSHAEGYYTQTFNQGEHACGKYNKSTKSTDAAEATMFSIGIGTSNSNRINAVEVKQNGDVYIIGIGDYNGKTTQGAFPLQWYHAE